MNIKVAVNAKASLGEGPSWDAKNNILYWVDISSGLLHIFDPLENIDRLISVGSMIGAVAPTSKGGVVAALKSGFSLINTDNGEVTSLCNPESDREGNRFNDGKCDPMGRFWAGTCAVNCDITGAGSLYCLDNKMGVRKALGNLTIANGLAWSPDHKTMYYIDTPTFEIWAFTFDNQNGEIGDRHVAVKVPEAIGLPDGMTVDSQGMLWVAHWGGGRICRWNPYTGALLDTIEFPVKNVSSYVFGGKYLNTLYVTSASWGLDKSALESQPLAGSLFSIEMLVDGEPTYEYGG